MNKTHPCCSPKNYPNRPLRLILLLIACLVAYGLTGTDMSGLFQGGETTNNIRVVFLIGLIASVSTCLAITGGVIVAYTDLTVDEYASKKTLWSHQLYLHLGRVVGFMVGGGLLGLLGQTIQYTLGVTVWITGLVAVFLLLLGLHILGLLPSWTIDTTIANNINTLGLRRGKKQRVNALFGALTFFIPCGFTQMAQLMALASGGWMLGGLVMGVFALGTFPGLLLLGVGTGFAKASHKQYFERGIAVVLIAFSLHSLHGSLALSGIKDTLYNNGQTMQERSLVNDRETVHVGHDGFQLTPTDIYLEAGKNYTITIQPESDGLGCMSTLVLPAIDKTIHPIEQGNDIVYSIENIQAGQYTFICSSMGMEQGKLIVQ